MKKILTLFFVTLISIMAVSTTAIAKRDVSKEEALATELKQLGIFYGVSLTDFDLEREPTRVEAVVMLIRILGKEAEATDGVWNHPFTDIPEWANNYIGYAYSKGLANGQSLTEFGTGKATSAMYITFVLRSLGYSDTNGQDFVWDNPYALAKQVGILPDSVDIENFWRADVVLVSHAALSANIKDTTQPLYEKLISAGVFTKEQFVSLYNSDVSLPEPKTELTPEEIYAKCSPSVFYIEVYDKYDNALGSGSGFFIDDKGTAVTNFHVIDGASSAYIQLSDTGKVLAVNGVFDYSKENDWAVIQVDCKGNSFLEIGSPSTAVGAATIYAIGSPLGLQNTISQGLISNPRREMDGTNYIQISAAISSGSSGGALINKYGEVIGITSAGFVDGQNLNLAIPLTYIENFSFETVTDIAEVNRQSITYFIDKPSVTIGVGETVYVSFDYEGVNFPDDPTFTLSSSNKSVASAIWADMDDNELPWDIAIKGLKEGVATITLSNDINSEVATILVTVTADNTATAPTQSASYNYLLAWVKKYGRPTDKGIEIQQKNEFYTFTIEYSYKYDNLSVSCSGYSGEYFHYTAIYLDTYFYGFAFDTLTVTGYLPAPTFTANSELTYTEYEGDPSLKNSILKSGKTQVQLLLYWLQNFLYENRVGVNLADLGFVSFK